LEFENKRIYSLQTLKHDLQDQCARANEKEKILKRYKNIAIRRRKQLTTITGAFIKARLIGSISDALEEFN